MYGDPWPTVGEFDIYENWNLAGANSITLHADNSSKVGSCTLTGTGQTGVLGGPNCDNYVSNPPVQYAGSGCSANEPLAPQFYDSGSVCKCLPSIPH